MSNGVEPAPPGFSTVEPPYGMLADMDDSGYWEWFDELLQHPDGRATGGEPCVKCGQPIQANAAWKHRDRHVCSSRCNVNLKRQLKRGLDRGEAPAVPLPPPMANPRTVPRPWTFGTLAEPDRVHGIPYDFEGFGPLPGDIVERDGSIVTYTWQVPEVPPEWAPHGFFVATHTSAHALVCGTNEDGACISSIIGQYDPAGQRSLYQSALVIDGQQMRWIMETIRHVTPDGRSFDWKAPICIPVEHLHPGTLWTAEYAAGLKQRKRASATAARHARRMRVEVATVEHFDPHEIYERDGWVCRLCGEPVNPAATWPDPLSASLDHVMPIIAGGAHSRANSQTAHWICNVRKGARWEPIG